MNATRCDLHLHSSASLGNDEWYTRYFGCPESYAEPARQYELCKARGMSLVTLTDHDTIAGGLTLVSLRSSSFQLLPLSGQEDTQRRRCRFVSWNA